MQIGPVAKEGASVMLKKVVLVGQSVVVETFVLVRAMRPDVVI